MHLPPFHSKRIFWSLSAGNQIRRKTYGAAQMIWANLFFYRKGDTESSNVHNVDELYNILGENILEGPTPKEDQGVTVDLSSGTGNVCF